MIKIENLTKKYTADAIALNNVSLEIKKGEFVSITGKSGCGKSTLLNILGGMDTQTEGSYQFNGVEVSSLNGKALAKFRNENIGFVFQSFYLMNDYNAIDNISLPLGYAHASAKRRKETALKLLEEVGLSHKAKSRPTQMSGGEQQRIAIARAVSNNPEVILADEPTGNLDEENGKRIMALLKKLNGQGLTVIMVTHDLDLAKQADRVICMSDGKITDKTL